MQRFLSICLTAAMLLTMCPMAGAAEPVNLKGTDGQTQTYSGLSITTAGGGTVEQSTNGQITLGTSGTYEISGTWSGTRNKDADNRISPVLFVPANIIAAVKLTNVKITLSNTVWWQCAFLIAPGATANIELAGENTLQSANGCAGLAVPEGAALTIGGTGSLTATAGQGAAGIGGSNSKEYSGTAGSITIRGGSVTATGGLYSAGIGGGANSAGGIITISGGSVEATGGEYGAGIGCGTNGTGGTFSTGTDGHAFILASSVYAAPISDKSQSTSWSGVIFEGDSPGKVYGSPALAADAEIPAGKTLEIESGKTLAIPAGVTLVNNGTITNNGTIDIQGGALACTPAGQLENHGTINGGSVAVAISTAEQLAALRDNVNTGNEYQGSLIILTSDIDLNSQEWTPIASDESNKQFQGTFDGGGHVISGLSINQPKKNKLGLFGVVGTSGTVKNLGVEGSVSGYGMAGGVCAHNRGALINCYFVGDITGLKNDDGGRFLGGVCGTNKKNIYLNNRAIISNCYHIGDVTVSEKPEQSATAGGVCAVNDRGSLENCYNSGNVSDAETSGGVCGDNYYSAGTIKNCYYLESGASTGVGDGKESDFAESRTAEQFADGTVAYELQAGKAEQVWGQSLTESKDDSPLLTSEPAKRVFKVTLDMPGGTPDETLYANPSYTLPAPPSNCNKWRAGDGALYREGQTAAITSDATFTAVQLDPVPYVDEAGALQTCEDYTVVESQTTWSDGWYVVNSSQTIGGRITVSGDVHLILADGCKLNAESGGIDVGSGNSLTIYGHSTGDGMGSLTAKGGDSQAGIGGGIYGEGGAITINGGTVNATGGSGLGGGAGIGGGLSGAGGAITIHGGSVTATGSTGVLGGGAGIGGGGSSSSAASISITGGVIVAEGGENGAAGIGGGGHEGELNNLALTGGWIQATGHKKPDGGGGANAIGGGAGKTAADLAGSNAIVLDGAAKTATFYGTGVTLTENATLPEGYTLEIAGGQTLTVNSGVTLTNSGTVKIEGAGKIDLKGTIAGNGDIQVPVTLNANGGSPETQTASVTYGKAYKESSLPQPTRSAYTFAGWYTQANGGERVDEKQVTQLTGHTLYAHWTENKSQVTVSFSKDTPAYGDTITITATIAAAPAANVLGAAAEPDKVRFSVGDTVLGTADVSGSTATLTDVVLTGSNWKPNTYTVTAEFGGSAAWTGSTGTAQLTVGKASPQVTPPQAKTGLVYTGGEQALISAGSTDSEDCTMVYSTDGTNYSTNIPIGVGAGTYTVRYRVTGNDYYSETEAQSISVTIAKAENSITGLSCAGIVFGETPSPSATAASGETPSYTYSSEENGTYGSWNTANAAGTWYVKAAVAESANYKAAESILSFQVAPEPEGQPNAKINYSEETLTGLTAGAGYSITPQNGQADEVTAGENGKIALKEGWFDKTLSIVKKASDKNHADSDAQTLTVPARPAAPDAPKVTGKTKTSVTVAAVALQEYKCVGAGESADDVAWQTSGEFINLTAGTEYTIYTRNKAVTDGSSAFAGNASSTTATTVTEDGSATVKPGETVVSGGTTIKNENGSITVTKDGTTTTITPPTPGGDVDVERGKVKAPGDSIVKTGEGPEITLGEAGGIVSGDGTITIPAGGTATSGTTPETTITAPPDGGTLKPTGDGGIEVSKGSTVQTGDDGPEITLGETGGTVGGDGTLTIPEGGTATLGTTPKTTITPPTGGGAIRPNTDGTVTIPGGSTVQTGDDGPEITVTGEGAAVGGDGSITLPQGGAAQMGTDPKTAITPPAGGGTIQPKPDGTVTVPESGIVKTGDGPTITLPGGGTGDKDGNVTADKVVVGDTTVTGAGTTVTPDGTVTVPSGGTVQTGDGPTITLPGGGTSGKDGTVTVPEGGTVQTGDGPTITLPGGGTGDKDGNVTADKVTVGETTVTGAGTTVTPGGTVTVPSGGTVQTGSGPTITLPSGGTTGEDGGITVPEDGTVTVSGEGGTTTTITPPNGGKITVNEDGQLVLPGGSTVQTGDGETVTVPDVGGVVDPNTGTMTPNSHTVTFDTNGGGAIALISVPHGGKITKPTDPDRSGYTFGGWYKEADCTTAWDFTTDTVTGDITLYAKWTRNSSGGTSALEARTLTDETGVTVTGGQIAKTAALAVAENGLHDAGDRGCDLLRAAQRAGHLLAVYDVALTGEFAGMLTVSLPVTGKDGETLTVARCEGGTLRLTEAKAADGAVSIETATLSPFAVLDGIYTEEELEELAGALPFTDVRETDWFYDSVKYVYEGGLMLGTGIAAFSPNEETTRGMVVTVLHRAAGGPEASEASGFTDVRPGAYYEEAVAWAAENNIVGGYGDGTFGPEDPVTREQFAAILYRYAGSPEPPETAPDFTDADEISDFAGDAMRWAVSKGILRGKEENRLDPGGTATRAEVAAMLMRFRQE